MRQEWHYAEAERLVHEANSIGHEDGEKAARFITAASVHATLATVPEGNQPSQRREADGTWVSVVD